ncbi:hypothetical protein HO173_008717 [Letharia columbiana]|uniref:RTA1-domain-containing protein n=1 Tax=Letharia columbiana TaxID=112416 RepID=A0A8H6L2L9_9LECA|nr:uncharacterized protein HO173_008717 [Letharia columbiana]KAF6233173.1 hypothetical protein HO173_008717 [Letharia columbiana]
MGQPNPPNYHNVTEQFQKERNITGTALINYALQNPNNDTAVGMAKKYCSLGCTPACPESWRAIFYRPSVGGNSVYMDIFLLILIAQIFFGVRHRTWTFLGGMVPGLLGEIIGYLGRILLWHNPYSMNFFLTYLICLTIAPAFLTASIYLCLSRLVTVCGPQYSRLAPRSYTYIFIGCDLFALVLQGAGGGIASTARTHAGSVSGAHVMVAGLAWQVVSMTLFMALWADFAIRVHKARVQGYLKNSQSDDFAVLRDSKKFRLLQVAIALATVMIYIRSIYRIAELQGGFSGKIANNQASFMIFEGPMIIIAVTALTVFHPGGVFGNLWKTSGHGNRGAAKYPKSVAIMLDGDNEELTQRERKNGFQVRERGPPF